MKLHVVEKHVVEGKEVWLDQIVNSEGSRSMDSIDYNEENTIHIINRGNAHFEPILGTQETQYNRQQSSNHDTPKKELKISAEEQSIKQERPSEESFKSEDSEKKSQESEQQSPGLSTGRIKKVANDPNQADSSQQSSNNRQSVRGNQPIDSAQHQQINPNSPDFIDSDDEREKNTELFSAIRNGDLQKVEELLKAGVKVDIIDKNNKDNTPLHYAIEREKKEIAEKLLQEWKADINAKNNKGDTPLHIATSKGNRKLVQLLVSKNANTDIKNNEDRTPLDTAKHLKRQDIVQILEPQIQPSLKVSVGDNQQIGSSVQQRSNLLEQVIRPKIPIHKVQKSDKVDDRDIKRPGKQGLHGEIYQLKLLMLFLKRGVDNQYSFRLSTEKKEAKKFDDLFFEITRDGKKEYRLLQAKHKDDESKKITFDNLLTESDSDYSLVKYFFSYQDSKKEKLFKNGMIKDVTVCTNINLDLGDKYELNGVSRRIREVVQKIEEKDNILDVDSETFAKEAVRYRFSDNVVLLLKPKLEDYNLTKLARRLAECFLKNNSIQHHQEHDIFKIYHTVLAKEVIDVKAKKFHDKFIKNEGISEDTQKFREAFAEEIKKQSKEVLTLEDINLVISNKRKVVDNKSVGLKLSKNFGNGEDKSWPNNAISDEDIKDFLDHLVFAVNQPNEEQLGKIIENDISKEFNFAAKDYVYNELFVKMLDWLNGKGEEFISYQDGNNFFEETKQKLSELELTGLTLEYKSKVEKFGIKFNSNAVQEIGLDEFLSAKDSNKQVFNAITQQNTLSAIKVYQVLQNIYGQNYIFMRLNSILHLQDRVVQAFKGSSNLLVIECKTKEKEEDIQILYDQLSSIIQSSSNKKVVLITQVNDLLANKFKSALRDKYQEKIDEKNSLIDLTNESQNKFLSEGKVIFQGEEVSLDTLVDDKSKYLIDGEVLSKLINHEKIKVGKALIDSKYEDIKDYYIPRTFNLQVKIKKDLKKKNSEFLMTYNSQIDEQSLKKNQDIVLISATDNGFKELCNKYKERNIHWLKQEGDDLIWQKSYGALSKLRDFIDTNEQAIQEYELKKIKDIEDRVVIISAEPGMGKSTVLTRLALKTKDSLWVIRINLLDYSTELKRETEKKTKLNEAEAIKFLYRIIGFQLFQGEKEETTEEKKQRVEMIENVLSAITVEESKIGLGDYREGIQGLNLLEIGLFNDFYSQGRIVLLFDGFDEISPDYTEKVIELLQVLKNSKVEKLWITTRPYNSIKERLENQLSIFSYSLKPLLLEEQKGFLRKFWKAKLELSELDEQRSGVFIDELLDKLPKSIGDKDFMSIPLHASMVAEIFKDAFESFYDSNEQELSDEYKKKIEELNLDTLYERFIDIKFHDIRFGEKNLGMNTAKPDMKRIIEKEYKKFIAGHGKLAVYSIFKEDEVRKLLPKKEIREARNLIKDIEQGKENTGIIERVIDNEPRLIHRTFAEYFASKLIYERLGYSKESKQEIWEFFLDHILIDDRYNVIRRFIDCQLIDSKLFELKIGNTVEKLLEKRIYKREITQLHVAAKEGLLETIKFLLNSLPNGDYINAKDNLGSTPLHDAVRNGHLEIIELLLERGGDVNAKTEMGFTPLHSAAQRLKIGNEKVVKLLLEKGADINAKTEDDETPLNRLEDFKSIEVYTRYKYEKDSNFIGFKSRALTFGEIIEFKIFDQDEKVREEYESLIHVPSEIILKSTQELFTIIKSEESDEGQKIKQLKDLIGKKGGVVGATYNGNTLFHLAAFKGYAEIVNELIACVKQNNPDGLINAEVNTLNNKATALHLAAFFGHEEVVKTLLKVDNINVNAKDSQGDTPIDLCYKLRLLGRADRNDHSKIVGLLLDRDSEEDLIGLIWDGSSDELIRSLYYERSERESNYKEVLKLLEEDRIKTESLVKGLDIDLNLEKILTQLLQKANSNDYSDIISALLDHNADIDSNLEGISSLFEVGNCLERRKRRNTDNCHFSWQEIDEFNLEKDEKRDFSKIKIDSGKFVDYIKDLPKEKSSQLIQLADKVKVIGESQSLVNKLISNQKVMNHLGKVGKISGMTMHGMMAKNVLADFLNGDYQGVAVNIGFIAGGQGFAKVAEAASFKGLKLASEGKLLLSRSLRAASPFLARGTSAFVIYDLVNQVKAFKNGTEEALVGVVGDSIYLGVDAAEIGIEVAEAFEVLEGVSSVTGPIGAAVGAVVFVGTDIYMAVKRVDKIDEVIHLTGKERFVEGLRAFIGMQPEEHIQELLQEKQVSNQLVKQGLEYLKQHSDIQSYIFSTGKSIVDSCRKVPYKTSTCASGGFGGGCLRASTVTRYAEKCTTKFEVDLDSTIQLDRKRTDIKWSRAKPDNPSGGELFCLPQGNHERVPSDGSYLCKNAIGVTDLSTTKTGNHTLINLEKGEDYAQGFTDSPNIFVVNDGFKGYYGGNKDDVFILQGDLVRGYLSGGDGIDTLDLTGFAQDAVSVDVYLNANTGDIIHGYHILRMGGMERVLGRKAKSERIFSICDTQFLDGQGGAENNSDIMVINNNDCTYKMQIIVRPNTNISNHAYNGVFNYTVLPGKGKAQINLSSLLSGTPTDRHNFFFNYTISQLMGIDVQNISQISNYTVKSATFSFLPTVNKSEGALDSKFEERFNITISDIPANASYVVSNGAEIKMGSKGNLYMLENTNKSVDEIIKDYLVVANRLNRMSFFIQSLLSNETVAIGSGNYEVIHNNPLQKSHLVGNGGENVYVIDSESKRFEIPLPEVVIYDLDVESSVDTIDLRNLVQQTKGEFSNSFKLQVLKSANDLLLKAIVEKPIGDSSISEKHEYFTVRLKDGVNWYNKTHVIMDNVPMRISLDNNEWSLKPQPLMFEKDKEVIVVTSQDVEENTELITPKKAGNYTFVRDHGSDLMITNAFNTQDDLCTIVLSKFYETPKMETLSIKFADKEIVLKDKQEEISTARYVDIVKREHKEQVYNDVFNRSPEVMLSDQPHRHQIRHRRSTSGSARPSSWINDLFGWVKSSIGGLLSSALSKETSSTPSSISQVHAPVDVNGTIMLLDVFVRKVTGQKYISTVDQSISRLEAQGYALNITKRFEKVLNETAIKSGISVTNLNFDPVTVQSAIVGQVISKNFSKISKSLYSFAKEACPEFKQTDKFLDHLRSNLKEEKETVLLQQKVEKPSKVLDQEVSRKVQLSKKPDTFLNGTSVVQGISRAIN